MDSYTQKYVDNFMAELTAKNPGEKEFHQAVREVLESVAPYIVEHPYLMEQKILERIVEPERIIMFRVPWLDDEGNIQINKGYRVQNSHRTIQGRYPFPPERKPQHHEVPCLRADLQEQPHHTSYGCRQRWFRLQS